MFERKFLENIAFFVTEIYTQQKNRFSESSKFILKKIIVEAITCIWKNDRLSTPGCDKQEFKKNLDKSVKKFLRYLVHRKGTFWKTPFWDTDVWSFEYA